jgi:hypothetical protein
MRCRATFVVLAAVAVPILLVPPAEADHRRSVADPGGATTWTADVRRGDAAREQCVVLRRGRTGKGTYCQRFSRRAVFEYTSRRETGAAIDPLRWRTVFVVNLAPEVERATLTTLDGVLTYRRGRGPRVLLAVLRGDVEQGELRVTVGRGERARTVTTGRPATLTVPDPVEGNPWRLARDADGGSACVRWERVRRYTPAERELARGPRRCGASNAPIAVAAADRADGRLIVSGTTRGDVRSVALRTSDGATRPVRRDRESGGFLAVLTGVTDPATLTVVATLRDGRQTTLELAR